MEEPRALVIDLGRTPPSLGPVPFPIPEHGADAVLARWGGSALGLACLAELTRREPAVEALVLAVGEGVRRGLPTAARATVLGRAPLTGLYSEGHVGGALGARLAHVTDALVLTGRSHEPGTVLVLEADGRSVRLAWPELAGAAPAETARLLERELGPCSVLCIGPAGERGIPFASLASGHSPPSFVGRGGLGARFGALGLKALCVRAPAEAAERAPSGELLARLAASPRLAARAAGGTLELFDAWAARGRMPGALGHALAGEARARAERRHGCRGCPTPCGWVFERSDGRRQGARFGAGQALGVDLGLESLDDALHLLGVCDRLGLDAKEAGAVLALGCRAQALGRLPGASAHGDREALARALERVLEMEHDPGRSGAARMAAALGLERELALSRGQVVRPEAGHAALLGQSVAAGGADPMRSFPFLLESVALEGARALLAPLPLPTGALDPDSPCAKGRLVFWHENLVSAVDMTGFCAFSAAGLLTDGLATLDELAGWILPAALRAPEDPLWGRLAPGQRLLAAGANLVLARRAWNQAHCAAAAGEASPAHAHLAEPGMLDEYRALRGLDARAQLTRAARAARGTPAVLALAALANEPLREDRAPARASAAPARAAGRVTLRAFGPLAARLGERLELELPLPCTVLALLRTVAGGDAEVARQIFAGERLVPTVWCRGRRLERGDSVAAGDELELLTAIGGG